MRGRNVHEIGVFQMLRAIYIVPYRKAMRSYIIYDVPIKPHKTRRWFHTAFSRYTFGNSGLKQRGGKKYQHKYSLFLPEFSYTCYLDIDHPSPTFIDQPGMYCVPSRGRVWRSVTPMDPGPSQ